MLARRAKKKAPTLGLGAETALACLCLGALALSPHFARARMAPARGARKVRCTATMPLSSLTAAMSAWR